MTTGLDALTDKEKQTLRLILRGHDAKSAARELALSVHTVNERLRDARRKLGVTSSREAARRLLAEEAPESPPEILADKPLGDASEATPAAKITASAARRWARSGLALPALGVLAMSLILAALILPATMVIQDTAPAPTASMQSESAGAARAAEDFLKLIDEGRWAESYAVTSASFRELSQIDTLERWSDVSARQRQPLGRMLTRDIVGNEFVPAPLAGYRLVKFRSAYANGTEQSESLSLVREGGAWKVAAIMVE